MVTKTVASKACSEINKRGKIESLSYGIMPDAKYKGKMDLKFTIMQGRIINGG